MASEHIVKAYDDQLKRLNQLIADMGGRAEVQLASAVQALSRRDARMAAEIVEQDARIDALEAEIDEFAVRMLALRQPMAGDLRDIVGSIRIASDLERIADYATNLAKRTLTLSQLPAVAPARGIPRMSKPVEGMIKDVLDAYMRRDAELALDVWKRDGEVDDLYTSLFRELLTYMMEDPRNITACTHLLFVAKNIERIGDHVTNIAETIHYRVTGEHIAEARPKSDTSAFEMVAAPEADGGRAGEEG